MKGDWIGLVQFVFAWAITAFALIKTAQEFFKSQVDKERMKTIDVEAIRSLMRSKEKFETDIDDLKQADVIHREDLKRIENDFKDIIKKFMDYQFKNFDDHNK